MQHWNKGLPTSTDKEGIYEFVFSLKFRASCFLQLFGQRMTDFQKLS